MAGTIWYCGGSVDLGRLIDDTDPAYQLVAVAAYRRLIALREQEAAASRA
jgi:hypothetical protein